MRRRAGIAASLALVGLATLWAIGPRLGYRFPSMVDDWNAIASSPEQLREVLRLGVPEELRYRPGFVLWNALQWHTLGAPDHLVGPEIWGLLRVAALVAGVLLLTVLVTEAGRTRLAPLDGRWLLVVGVPLAVVTAPALSVDLARYGPQEPLLVGCMALGAFLSVRSLDALLAPDPLRATTVVAAVAGVCAWSFGVLQKETSTSLLVLVPFLWPVVRSERLRWARLDNPRRAGIGLVVGGIVLPFVPMVTRTIQLSLADERVYEDAAAGRSLAERLSDQLSDASEAVDSRLPTIVFLAAIVVLGAVAIRRGTDWLATGLLVGALAFVVFAAESGVVTSRYYLPPFTLAALALARGAVSLAPVVVVAAGAVLVAGGLLQTRTAHEWVGGWVDQERARETLVREAAARAAGGCRVDAVGLNTELVHALPVLMPLADEPPRDCAPGRRFVVLIDRGAPGTVTPPDDPVLAACAPKRTPVWSSEVGDILRCTR